ncbi:HPr family phosphocarrier protein [Caproiciproducens sp. CPB-2]|jgi:Phosphotransferase System HPr (HPr) Family|uniref:HPr family phosphocarrier protein n=1 Tax=Caproiciproducens sp. CPB-2 TaxID=3030017 RepID=UPI00056E4850|nr:HPr family phosphocarrier protein [Caproiciproducens sp. CPB-2]MDF1494303.1 HPr family phosphocarrier protein [Caproiciproducens sp. CPB-2]
MKEFYYSVRDEMGIHARPAGILAKEAKKYSSSVTISRDKSSADLKKLFAVMQLAVKQGEKIRVSVEGPDEAEAAAALERFFRENV